MTTKTTKAASTEPTAEETNVAADLIAAVENLQKAAAAFAENTTVPLSDVPSNIANYRLTFAGRYLYSVVFN
jgi:phospholipase/lecithinase/hemolysin